MKLYGQLLIVLALLTTLGAGCSRKEAQSPTASTQKPASSPASQPSQAPTTLSVSTVELGRSVGADKRVTNKTEVFKPADTIYVSIVTAGSAPSATLQARWTYQDGQLVKESTQTVAPTETAVSEFHISKPDGWPVGSYTVEVLLNGSSTQKIDFKVV
jgi:hypothetical protein